MSRDSPRRPNTDGYDPRTNTYRVTHDRSAGRSLALTVVDTVSALDGRAPTDCEPLHETVDPEALEALFAGTDAEGYVRFEYLGHRVTVRATGEVIVHDSK